MFLRLRQEEEAPPRKPASAPPVALESPEIGAKLSRVNGF